MEGGAKQQAQAVSGVCSTRIAAPRPTGIWFESIIDGRIRLAKLVRKPVQGK
jgi:hypothetical protein